MSTDFRIPPTYKIKILKEISKLTGMDINTLIQDKPTVEYTVVNETGSEQLITISTSLTLELCSRYLYHFKQDKVFICGFSKLESDNPSYIKQLSKEGREYALLLMVGCDSLSELRLDPTVEQDMLTTISYLELRRLYQLFNQPKLYSTKCVFLNLCCELDADLFAIKHVPTSLYSLSTILKHLYTQLNNLLGVTYLHRPLK